jgi:hypothetical protein
MNELHVYLKRLLLLFLLQFSETLFVPITREKKWNPTCELYDSHFQGMFPLIQRNPFSHCYVSDQKVQGWWCSSVVEHLHSMHKILGSIPSPGKTNNRRCWFSSLLTGNEKENGLGFVAWPLPFQNWVHVKLQASCLEKSKFFIPH